ncbi:unnamed protein product [Rhodiola kirilowii]
MALARAASSDSIKPRDVCIVGIARTRMGGFLGSLSSLSATKLGSIAIKSALQRANIDPSLVEEVFFGNVLSANLGQAPARQAALCAGIPNSVVCTTINKVCSSGMKATMIAAISNQSGANDIVVTGGMESMSNAPKYIARVGPRLGNDTIVDGLMKDGLWDDRASAACEAVLLVKLRKLLAIGILLLIGISFLVPFVVDNGGSTAVLCGLNWLVFCQSMSVMVLVVFLSVQHCLCQNLY